MNKLSGGTLVGLLAWGLLSCGSVDDKVDEPADTEVFGTFCTGAEATLEVPVEAVGDVPLTFTLVHPEEETAQVRLEWSDDGDNWRDLTVTGELFELASSSTGVDHTVTWDTVSDLGSGQHEDLQMRLRVSSACGSWPAAVVEDITVRNVEEVVATCSVEMNAPEGVQDGDVVLAFVLRHPQATSSWVELEWSADEGGSWSPVEVEEVDCDGDDTPDAELSDLETSEEGVNHCVTWNSDAVLNIDTELSVRAACGVGQEQQSTDEISFDLENDLTPDPGELIISELMLTSDHPGGNYIEIHSLANHTLDLDGVALQRWNAGLAPTDAPSSRFDIGVPSGTLLIEPGDYLVMARSDDPADNGCLNPDLVLDPGFTLYVNSSLGLSVGGVLLAHVPFLYTDGWFFQANQAMGVEPAAYRDPSWADIAGWCGQLTSVNGCTQNPTPGIAGTPGEVNDTCAP